MICLQTPTVFRLVGRTADVSCRTCVGLMMLGSRVQYIQLSHRCLSLLVLRLGWLLKLEKVTNHWQVTEYDHH